ncbi:MAG: hypothetical protein LCH73_13470 [Proteobacteria bacterium]|nr:hypothetical protein [Pseudomonadota bacterium]
MQPTTTTARAWLAAAVLTALCAQSAQSQTLYAYRLAQQKIGCFAEGINDSGQIVGTHDQGSGVAFLSLPHGGAIRNLSQPGDMWSKATAVNNAGVVIGRYRDALGQWLTFLTDADGANRRPYPLPPGMASFGPRDLNDAGQVLGARDGEASAIVQADGFSWQDVEAPADAVGPVALRLNESGQVIGWASFAPPSTATYGFVTGPGGLGAAWLRTPATHLAVYVHGLNDLGQVAGTLTTLNESTRGFISNPGPSGGAYLKRAGQPHDSIEVLGIDSQGRAYGSLHEKLPSGERRRFAYVAGPDRKVVDLNPLVVNLPPGVALKQVRDINRNGQMAVQAGTLGGEDNNICYIVCPEPRCTPG